MKKIILPFLVVLVFICAGCGTADTAAVNDGAEEQITYEMPETDADLTGKVTRVTGNEITILAVDRSAMEDRRQAAVAEESVGENAEGDVPVQEEAEPDVDGSVPGEATEAGSGRPDFDEEEVLKESKTVSFVIPVGMPIASMSRGEEGITLAQAYLTDISTDSMLRVWLDENGNASFVILSNMTSGSGGMGMGSGDGPPPGAMGGQGR